MHLHFLGANRQVTGSRHLLHAGGRNLLVDCGMFQEREHLGRNWAASPVPADEIDAVLLTHGHLDHCGLLPVLVREGFRGPILCTPPTCDLARIVWEDAAKIQVEDAAHKKRRHAREGRRGPHPEVPLFTPEDVERAIPHLKPVRYDAPVPVAPGVVATWRDAGHILGSAMIEVEARKADGPAAGARGEPVRIVFSGDIGQRDRPLMRDPARIARADHVVMESTYGDRDHLGAGEDPEAELERIVNETVERGGNLVVPTFAIDRAQQLLHLFGRLARAGRIPRITVFMDSPMAVSVTTVYKRYPHLLDEEARAMMRRGEHPFQFPGLHFVRSAEESRAINSIRGSCVVLAGSGMCTGGRVKHHLRQNLSREASTVMFTGYQARGTLGRRIVDGEKEVRIHGREFPVRAAIRMLDGLSAHADRTGLLEWLGGFETPPRSVFLVHGEEEAATALAAAIDERGLAGTTVLPDFDERWRVAAGTAATRFDGEPSAGPVGT